MSSGALPTDGSHTFRPKINRHSRRLTSGLLSVEERQKYDIARRESHHRELVARIEEERQLFETFRPATNRRSARPSGVGGGSNGSFSGGQPALIPKTKPGDPEETFRPVINAKSQRMMTDGTWQSSQQQAQEVRQRVQTLWRSHADIGSGEITLGGVYAALKELGLQPPSPMVDKFLLALGIDEAAGVRCVPYDRFMKVFTVVLRAALVAPAGGGTENRSSLGNNNDNNSSKSEEEGAPRAHSPIRRDPQPTMRRSLPSATVINREAVGSGCAKPQLTSAREARRLLLVSECDTEVDKPNRNENDDNSPSPEAPHEKAVRRKSIVDDRRGTSEGSLGLSCSAEAATVEKKKTKKTPYDPLKGCTFAPAINKKIYRTSSAHLVSAEKEKQGEKAGEQQSRRKVPGVVPYKSKEEREMEECTFAPETARFHKGRDSLAWWTREPFIGRSGETTSSIAAEEERSIDGSACDGVSSRPQQQQQQQRQVWASRASPVPLTIGFDKAVQRMMEARKKCRPKFEEMLRSTNEEPHKPLRPTVVEPFTLHAEARHLRREHQKPVLYVDVDLPSGKTGRIGVHRGDKAADLARGFAHAYRLGDELRERLECVLTEKINELLRENVRTLWL